jgi:prepilin-type N-terminal cleavage/methylation domain-containing protein
VRAAWCAEANRVRVQPAVRDEDGFTLIEVMVAMAVILVGTFATITIADRASTATSQAKTRQTGTSLARDLLETAQGLPYGSVAASSIVTTMQGKGFPDDSTATGWQVTRNGIKFTVVATVCSVDDSTDGAGVHAAGTSFCSDTPAGTADPNADDYKRVTFTVTPPASTGPAVTETTIVGASRATKVASVGSGAQNPVTGLVLTSPSTLYFGQVAPCANASSCTFYSQTNAAVTPKSITFQATTASSAAQVRFFVDGQAMVNVAGPGQTFNWTWNLPDDQPDGVYTVAAQAYDATGSTPQGEANPLTVTINRYKPDGTAYAVPLAGRNPLFSNIPEIETYPSNAAGARVDRDVTGFEFWVYQGSGPGTKFCTTSSVNTRWCAELDAPSNGSARTYAIAANGLNPDGTAQAGTVSGKSSDVNLTNTRPNPPTGVTVSRTGSVAHVSWTVPTGSGDPDSGDCVLFFRVYSKPAGSTSAWTYTDRVERTPFGNPVSPCGADATETSTNVDLGEADGATKDYRVTAVDRQMAESTMASGTG